MDGKHLEVFSRLIARACAISVTELFIPDTYLNISGLKQKRENASRIQREGTFFDGPTN